MKEIVITSNEAGQRFDKFLRKYLKDMPLSAIYKAIRKKQVIVNGLKSSEKYLLNEGDKIKFNIDVEDTIKEKNLNFLNIERDFRIAYEDANLLIVEKNQGTLVHPDEGKDENNLTNQVLNYLYGKKEYIPEKEKTFSPSPCNRLDRNTEGLIIFAKNYDTLKAVNESIREGHIEKYYNTIVKGRINDGIYTAYIIKDRNKNSVKVYDSPREGAKEVITEVKTIDSCGTFSELEINLVTGRSHQIRAHLSSLGNPVVGDPKYGSKEVNDFFSKQYGIRYQILMAHKIIFRKCPKDLKYMEGKVITMPINPVLKKIKRDLFRL